MALPEGFAATDKALLSDPQASGRLLVSRAPELAADVPARFAHHGLDRAAVIGTVTGEALRLTVA